MLGIPRRLYLVAEILIFKAISFSGLELIVRFLYFLLKNRAAATYRLVSKFLNNFIQIIVIYSYHEY